MRTHRNRHLILLLFILLLFIVSPMVLALRHGILIINIVGAGVLIAASYALSRHKHLFVTAIILSVISVILTCWLVYAPGLAVMLMSQTSIVVMVGFFVVTILIYVVQAGRITADRIYAAICVYMLIGYGWSFAYAMLDELQPDAFAVPNRVEANDYASRVMQLRYFSFVTLTTMGYGDITPRSAGARTMAVLEAVVGQIYLVTLVGRLVGLHIVHSRSEEDEFAA